MSTSSVPIKPNAAFIDGYNNLIVRVHRNVIREDDFIVPTAAFIYSDGTVIYGEPERVAAAFALRQITFAERDDLLALEKEFDEVRRTLALRRAAVYGKGKDAVKADFDDFINSGHEAQ